MPKVSEMNGKNDPSWSDVIQLLDVVTDHPGDKYMSLSIDEEHSLVVYYTDRGFLITGWGMDDHDFYVLIDPSKTNEKVTVWCAGDDMVRPNKVFVPEDIALKAVKSYFETGQRDRELHWEIDNNCW